MSKPYIKTRHSLHRQRGMTLIIALIMLFMITMATVASFQMSKTNLDIVGNMQFSKEAVEASNSAIQEAITTTRLFTTPDTIFLQSCDGDFNRRCFDFNNDGTVDITVDLDPDPSCVQAQPIPNAAIFTVSAPLDCATGVTQGIFAIQGAVTGNSLCSNSTWQVTAVAADTASQATTTVVEGAAVMVETANVIASCPGALPPGI